ncbi:MAG: polysaccharide deacetylase family protein, partial [bacterium]
MNRGRVSFTFDDGCLSTHANVFPRLRDAGIRGNLAVVTDYVGKENKYSWRQIAGMAAAGWEILSHSRTHDFRDMTPEKNRAEVVESREILQGRGYAARIFNFPGGPWSGETQFAPGTLFDDLVRWTYDAYLPDQGPHPLVEPLDRYNLGHLCCECYGIAKYEAPLEEVFTIVDRAAADGSWCQLLWHDVQGAYVEKLERVIARVVPLVRAGKLANV